MKPWLNTVFATGSPVDLLVGFVGWFGDGGAGGKDGLDVALVVIICP
jgi:hypothetical protein